MKAGDMIEVRDSKTSEWAKREYVGMTENGKYICKSVTSEHKMYVWHYCKESECK